MADLGLDFAGSNTLELEDNTELANEGEQETKNSYLVVITLCEGNSGSENT